MKPRVTFETLLPAAFVIAMLVVVALALSAWYSSREIHLAARLVAHTNEVLDHLADAKENTLLVEFNAQSYRISEDPVHLVARDAAIKAREVSLRRLKELTADNPRQQERWVQLRATIDERMAIARRSEFLRKTEGAEAARVHAAGAPLLETRERVFSLLRAMDDEERRFLQERNAEQSELREFRTALRRFPAAFIPMVRKFWLSPQNAKVE